MRFKKMKNCTFLGPKYRQLIYQITTNSLIDGIRLHYTNPLRGHCADCGVVASTQHMLMDCTYTKSMWCLIDQLGSKHWNDYKPLVYDQIPNILEVYEPINIYHTSALWSLWVTWCKHFYDAKPIHDWKKEIFTQLKKQFHKRIAEAPSMTQWIKLVQNRRSRSRSVQNDSSEHVSEKGFLLFHTQSIKSNLPHLVCDENGPNPNILKWIGNGLLVTIDYDALHGNKPRLKLNHLPWIDLVHPNDPSTPPPSGWISSLPLSVLGN